MRRHLIGWTLLFLLSCGGSAWAADSVCVQCHGGLDGRLSAPVAEWQQSIHADNGIACHDCHGGDPSDFAMAMDPQRGFVGVPDYGDVPDFCGRCHLGVAEDYRDSAHGKALNRGGPQCVVCHQNHHVVKASSDLINPESCSRCHDYERAATVKQEIGDTEMRLTTLERSVAALHRVGIDMETVSGELFQNRNAFRRLFHTVDIDKLKQKKAGVNAELDQVEAQIVEIESELSQRKMIGGILVVLLLLAGAVALLIRQTYHQEEHD